MLQRRFELRLFIALRAKSLLILFLSARRQGGNRRYRICVRSSIPCKRQKKRRSVDRLFSGAPAEIRTPAFYRASRKSLYFSIPIGSASVVYHNLSDFKSDKARRLMFKAIDTRAGIQRIEEQLNTLRAAYRTGDTSGAIRILDLEQQLDSARTTYRDLVNQAIEAELNR